MKPHSSWQCEEEKKNNALVPEDITESLNRANYNNSTLLYVSIILS